MLGNKCREEFAEQVYPPVQACGDGLRERRRCYHCAAVRAAATGTMNRIDGRERLARTAQARF